MGLDGYGFWWVSSCVSVHLGASGSGSGRVWSLEVFCVSSYVSVRLGLGLDGSRLRTGLDCRRVWTLDVYGRVWTCLVGSGWVWMGMGSGGCLAASWCISVRLGLGLDVSGLWTGLDS